MLESLDDDEVNFRVAGSMRALEFWPNSNELGANVDELDASLSKLFSGRADVMGGRYV